MLCHKQHFVLEDVPPELQTLFRFRHSLLHTGPKVLHDAVVKTLLFWMEELVWTKEPMAVLRMTNLALRASPTHARSGPPVSSNATHLPKFRPTICQSLSGVAARFAKDASVGAPSVSQKESHGKPPNNCEASPCDAVCPLSALPTLSP